MANVVTSNPMYVDTVGALGINGATVINMAWLHTEQTNRDIAVNDDLRLRRRDVTGDVIVDKRASATADELIQEFPGGLGLVGDIYVDAIDGGVLFIYTK